MGNIKMCLGHHITKAWTDKNAVMGKKVLPAITTIYNIATPWGIGTLGF
jgi:hypothetical protein